MFLRIRGKGASPENSQAAVMHLRGFRHIAVEVPPLLNTFISSDSANFCLDQRPFVFVHFATGIDAMTLMDRQCECFMSCTSSVATDHKRTNIESKNEIKPIDLFDEERRLVWKETWNLYDIVYDEVPLLPSSFELTNNLLKQLYQICERVRLIDHDATSRSDQTDSVSATNALLSVEPVPSSFTRPTTWIGNKKAVVCTHYYAPETMPAEELEVQYLPFIRESGNRHLSLQTAAFSSSSFSSSSSTVTQTPLPSQESHEKKHQQGQNLIQDDIIVLDLSNISNETAGSRLALEMAWLAAFITLQDYNYLFSARGIVVRLPYDHVPSVHSLQRLQEVILAYGTDQNLPKEANIKSFGSKGEESNNQQSNIHKEQIEERLEERELSAAKAQMHHLMPLMSQENQANILNAIRMALEAFDFLAEHLTLLHSSFAQIYSQFVERQRTQYNRDNNNNITSLQVNRLTEKEEEEKTKKDIKEKKETNNATNLSNERFTKCKLPSQQICFIDRSEETLQRTLTSLCVHGNHTKDITNEISPRHVCNVVCVIGDHHEKQAWKDPHDSSVPTPTPTSTSTHEITQQLSESYSEHISHVLQTLPCICSHVTLVAPLRALINDEEEAWDPYVQRERARLNYCPCCSNCSHHH